MRLQFVAEDKPTRDKKTCSSDTIQNQKYASGQQNGKCQQCDDGSNEPRPRAVGHAGQRHSLGPQIQSRGNEVQSAEQRGHAKDSNGNRPKILAQSQARAGVPSPTTKRSERGPTRDRLSL